MAVDEKITSSRVQSEEHAMPEGEIRERETTTSSKPAEPAGAPLATKEPLSRRHIVAIAIISSIALFFLGLGTGVVIGRSYGIYRNRMMNGYYNDGYRDGMMRYQRGYYYQNSTPQTVPNQGTTNNPPTAPPTQTN